MQTKVMAFFSIADRIYRCFAYWLYLLFHADFVNEEEGWLAFAAVPLRDVVL